MDNHQKQITLGAVLSYVNIALGAIITLLYTPFMIRSLGKSEYGLYNTVASVISSLSILSLGFGSGYVRFFSRYKAENKQDDIAKLNGMFLVIFGIIGVVAFFCGMFLTVHLDYVFSDGLTSSELDTARILMMLLTFNLSISFPASVFSSIITAHEQFVFQKTLVLLKQVLSPLVCIPLLQMGFASIGMVVSSVIISLLVDCVNIAFCMRKLHVRFVFHHFSRCIFSELAVYSSFIAVNMVVDQINLNIDKILLGRFCGTDSVAVYSAGYVLYNYYHSFSTSISNVFTPRIHHIWSDTELTEDQKSQKLSHVFASVGRIQFIILWLVCSGLIFFGNQFIRIWAGKGYDNAYYVALLLTISSIVPLSQNVGIEIQRAKNKHQFRSILYAIMAIINLAISIYLCQIYGEIGSAIGTAISFVIANTFIMNWFYSKVLKIDISEYWRATCKILLASVPAILVGLFYCRMVDSFAIIQMLLGICLYSVVYIMCVYKFALNIDERQIIIKKLQRKR